MSASSLGGGGRGGDQERGAALLSPSRGGSAAALTCGREDGERCSYAEGNADDPQKRVAVRRLYIAMTLCGTFMLVEFIGGYYAHSLAVMSDAAHLLSDLGTLCMSLVTLTYAARRAPATHSFGLHRAELLGALFSVASLWAVTGALLYAAFQRLKAPQHVDGRAMMGIALLGVAVNVALAAVLQGAQGHGHSHGGLRGAEGAACGGHGHSHGAGAACEGEDEEAGLLQPSAQAQGACCGHSHLAAPAAADVAAAVALRAPLRLSSAAAASEPPPLPPGAVFFTRGRMPAAAAQQQAEGESLPGGTVPPALAAAALAAQAAPPGRLSSLRSASGATGGEANTSTAAATAATDVNMRAAYLHVLADLAQSCGVALAGLVIWLQPALRWVDPACTLVFSTAVLFASARLLRDVSDVIMERTPRGVDPAALAAELAALPGVAGVHDLHVWALMPGKLLLTVHLDAQRGARSRDVLLSAQRVANKRLGAAHATIQVEGADA